VVHLDLENKEFQHELLIWKFIFIRKKNDPLTSSSAWEISCGDDDHDGGGGAWGWYALEKKKIDVKVYLWKWDNLV